jgi:hypothetical protein
MNSEPPNVVVYLEENLARPSEEKEGANDLQIMKLSPPEMHLAIDPRRIHSLSKAPDHYP